MSTEQIRLAIAPIFSDGMVLQREQPLKIWGTAHPNETLDLQFRGKKYLAKSDTTGHWYVELAPQEAGGPFELIIEGTKERLVIEDILVGDVWLLGGQSNMELPIQRTLDLYANEVQEATNPWIRQFRVAMTYDFNGPQRIIQGGPWRSVTPNTVMEFSALGYFFAQAHYEKYKVPVGLVLTAVGGTPVEAWLSERMLRSLGQYEEILDLCKDVTFIQETTTREMERLNNWYGELNSSDAGLRKETVPWSCPDLDDSDWDFFTVPGSFGDTPLEGVHGAVWFRRTFELSDEILGTGALLRLGAIIDADEAYINGTLVGRTDYKYPPRKYQVNQEILLPGTNYIALRVISNRGIGGFVEGKSYALELGPHRVELAGKWKYKVGVTMDVLPQLTFFHYKPSGVYNGMIAPLAGCRFRGILWYQGESNTHTAENYQGLFRALIKNWRETFASPDLPFFYVQLPNFDASRETAVPYKWAELRDAQLKALDVPGTAMVVAIDLGEENDLHPQNKKDIALRLSLNVQKLIFGEPIIAQGPRVQRLEQRGSELVIYFTELGGGLVAKGGLLAGFDVCGAEGRYYPAQALIEGDTIIVRSSAVNDPKGVRYAWEDNPVKANLYNKANLPASPFRIHLS